MDQFIDLLLREEIVFGVTLPFLPKRYLLEEQGQLPEYRSPIQEEYEAVHGKKKKRQKEENSSNGDQIHEESSSEEVKSEERGKPKVKDETSIEYWNELRSRIGLKVLKDTDKDDKHGGGAQSLINLLDSHKKDKKKNDKSPKNDRKRRRNEVSPKESKSQAKDTESVEYWNELRAKMGMKKLKK
jgi:hypothetical protein